MAQRDFPQDANFKGALKINDTQVNATADEINQFADASAWEETLIDAGAMSLTKRVTKLALAATGAVTLAAPTVPGIVKVIEMTADNGDVTFSLANCIGQSSGTTATFNDVRDQLVLISGTDKWIVVKERGITLS